MKLRSYFLEQSQIDVINVLSAATGKSKAAVLRGIIDDWVSSKKVEPKAKQATVLQ